MLTEGSHVWCQVSFLGRVSSSALGDGTKLVSQLGATRSFVFGKENSHLGISRDLDPPQVGLLTHHSAAEEQVLACF